MSEPAIQSLVAFMRSIAVLALDAPTQLAWLASLGLPGTPSVTDELALEFDDGYRLIPRFVANGWLSAESGGLLAPIDAALAAMSGPSNADVWAVEALESDPRWMEVRVLAREALIRLR
jgi:hypothetical protein